MDFRATCSLQDMDYHKAITYKYKYTSIICNIVKFQLSEHEETHVTLHLRESTVSRCRTKKKEPSFFFFARVLHGMRCIRPFAFVRKLKAEGFRPGVALQGWVEWNGME